MSWGAKSKDIERFWNRVQKGTGCWTWKLGKDRDGYGIFQLERRQWRAHRLSYQLTYGEFDSRLLVCHSCDNRECVRPDHLFLGTNTDNMRDASKKGRLPRGDNHPHRKHPERLTRGDAHYWTKVTSDLSKEIRARYLAGGIKQQELADMYGVSNQLISLVVRGVNGSAA